MGTFHVEVGRHASFSKTIGESDVYLFAGITGDLSPNHVNQQFMTDTLYGERIAHGALIIGYMSNTSSRILEGINSGDEVAVSLGYDRIRFVNAALIGDTVTVTYTIIEIDEIKRRSYAKCEVTNQNGELVAVATHILKWVKKAS